MSDMLPTDQYYIRNDNLFAGRNSREDRSLRPKGVFCPTDNRDPELVSALSSIDGATVPLTVFNSRSGKFGHSPMVVTDLVPAEPPPVQKIAFCLHSFLKIRGLKNGSLPDEMSMIQTAAYTRELTFHLQRNKANFSCSIESADRNAGWVAQVDATDPQARYLFKNVIFWILLMGSCLLQIAVRPLIVGPSDPPFFPPNELWNIQPLVD